MRITAHLSVFVAGLMLAVTGCGGTEVPNETPVSESVQAPAQPAPQSSEHTVTQMSVCPQMWYCDTTNAYYSTSTQCAAACGSVACYRDYRCNGTCLCP